MVAVNVAVREDVAVQVGVFVRVGVLVDVEVGVGEKTGVSVGGRRVWSMGSARVVEWFSTGAFANATMARRIISPVTTLENTRRFECFIAGLLST